MRKLLFVLPVAAAALLGLPSAARADVQLTINDGVVSLNATNATVRQILEQWAKVGQTKIVNVERVTGAPLTLQLVDMPEERALDVILRSVSGYLAAPRATAAPNLSRYDRILVLPTSSPRNTPAAPPAYQQPQFTPPPMPLPMPDDDDDTRDEDEEPTPNVVMPNPRGAVFNAFPQPVPTPQGGANSAQQPPAVPPTTYQPTAPVGVSVPGMVVQPPQQPGQVPGQPDPREP
jgi:hypothetical protein